MSSAITIRCGRGCDPIVVPAPDDLGMLRDLIAAHGATHGEDWRDEADRVMAIVGYQIEMNRSRP